MKPYASDDELERALFALPLEEPPDGLRAAILAATVHHRPLAVRPCEVWAFGLVCALATWLLVLVLRGGAAPEFGTADTYVNQGLALFAQPQTLFWIALGGGAAFWVSQANLTVAPGAARTDRR